MRPADKSHPELQCEDVRPVSTAAAPWRWRDTVRVSASSSSLMNTRVVLTFTRVCLKSRGFRF